MSAVYKNDDGEFFIGPLSQEQYETVVAALNLANYWNERNRRDVAWALLKLISLGEDNELFNPPNLPRSGDVPTSPSAGTVQEPE